MSNLNDISILFLICHFLGDFQLQSEHMARRKATNTKYILNHVSIHAALLLIPLIYGIINKAFLQTFLAIIIILSIHTCVDYGKVYLSKNTKLDRTFLFVLDQILHIGVIVAIALLPVLKDIDQITTFAITRIHLNWILLAIVVTKPANILFKIAFKKYNLNNVNDNTESGAGALIGNIERLISIIFVSLNQFGAIGLIYTAKSIARYKQIEENKRFAEYYLIGNLFSILYGIASYYLIITS